MRIAAPLGMDKLQQLLQGIRQARVVMITTVSEEGTLHSRPMATVESDDDGTLWFFTSKHSHKAHEIEHDHHVAVAFENVTDRIYVSISGRASLVRDNARARALWDTRYATWFPQGPEDEDLVFLCVKPESIEYWDSQTGVQGELLRLPRTQAA